MTGFLLEDRDSILEGGTDFFLAITFRLPLGPTEPLSKWIPAILLPWVKQPDLEANHSPAANMEMKNAWCMEICFQSFIRFHGRLVA
jgi:hypothetical protein